MVNKNTPETITEGLLNILNLSQTSPFLFIGTGLSRRYLNIADWQGLLRIFAEKASQSSLAFEMYKEEASHLTGMEKTKLYPQIATLIEKDFNKLWYRDKDYEKSRETNAHLIKKGVSPFKIELSEYFKNNSVIRDKTNNNEIHLLTKVGDKNISGIITTNYDTFLEQIFPEYKIYVGQQELIFSPIQGIGEIYKIHGCCTNPATIFINSNDYASFAERNAYLSSKLLTLFLEHPIIFIGYSITDENISNILKSIIKCLDQEQLTKLKRRLIFIEWNNKAANLPNEISTYSKTFDDGKYLEMTRVFIDDFSILYQSLLNNKSKSRYSITTLRKLKEDIYELVLTNDPKGRIKVVSPINSENEDKTFDYVIGIGVSKNFGIKGLISITNEDVYKDILFNDLSSNPEFDLEIFIERTLPDLLGRYTNSIPIYKYIKMFNNNDALPEKVKSQIKENYDDFLNRTIRNQPINTTIKAIRGECDLLDCLKYIPRITDEKNIIKEDLYEYLRDLLRDYPDILSRTNDNPFKSSVRRLIKIYDWFQYYKK